MLMCFPLQHEYLFTLAIPKISLICTLLDSPSKLLALLDKSWLCI